MMARVEEQLPSEWSVDSLGSLVESVRASARILPGEIYELWSVPSFSTGMPEVVTGESIGSGKLEIRPDDVLISKINPRINRVWLVSPSEGSRPKIGSTEWLVARIRPGVELLPSYLALYMKSPTVRESIKGMTQGVTGSHTRAKANQILTIPVPLPSTREQTKIVEILEEQLSRLDAAVKSVQTIREKAAQFRRSLLHAAFTGNRAIDFELQPYETTFKDFELGELLVDIQSGFASGKHNASGIGVIHIRPMNISRRGVLDFSEKKFVENVDGHRLRRGDVLFNNTNSPALVGKTALVDVDTELAFSNHMTRLRVNESRILSTYLALRLHALWEDGYFESICSNHVNQASVSSKRLSRVTIAVPELSVQHAIVENLQVLLSNLDATLAVADEVERKTKALRRSLLHGAFTGELTRSWREAHV